MKEKRKFITFIEMLIKRPAMFQVNRVEDIWLISFGYQRGLDEVSINMIGNLLLDFRKFTNNHFESNTDSSWERLIRFYSSSDSHSIELFTTLFNSYIIKKFPQ